MRYVGLNYRTTWDRIRIVRIKLCVKYVASSQHVMEPPATSLTLGAKLRIIAGIVHRKRRTEYVALQFKVGTGKVESVLARRIALVAWDSPLPHSEITFHGCRQALCTVLPRS